MGNSILRRTVRLARLCCLVGALLIAAGNGSELGAQAMNSPFPMFKHDFQHTGRSDYKGTDTAESKWTYPTTDQIVSSPVLNDEGIIYFGSLDGNLYALKP
ncbi:MAG: hypothetical protein ACUZ8A_04830 [Candidatus Bathyanammoxibius sp.]